MGLSYNIADKGGTPVVELSGSVDENSESVLRKIHDDCIADRYFGSLCADLPVASAHFV